jgi:hypothetical protein
VAAAPPAGLSLGPPSPCHPARAGGHLHGPDLSIGDLVLEIDEEYLAVVQAADAELDGPERLPPDPLPDV